MKCDLCQRQFNIRESRGHACRGCGFWGGCNGVRCPYCGYEMFPSPKRPAWMKKIIGFLKQLTLKKPDPHQEDTDRLAADNLAQLKVHETVEVVHLSDQDPRKLQKLISLGVLPGAVIHLDQKFPAYVFRMEESLFSLDKELAQLVHVKPAPR